jgi:hypothetical protein
MRLDTYLRDLRDLRDLRPFFLYIPFSPLDPVHTTYGAPVADARDQHEFAFQYFLVVRVLFLRDDLRAGALLVIERVTAILILPPESYGTPAQPIPRSLSCPNSDECADYNIQYLTTAT